MLNAVADSYPGPVELIMIQFPTPYRLVDSSATARTNNTSDTEAGNSQLPLSATNGFMVSKQLLQRAGEILGQDKNDGSGHLLLQSNCEDVAIYMRATAFDLGLFQVVEPSLCQTMESIELQTPTQRSVSWIAMGGPRAVGPGWWSNPVLPRRGRTETEVACMLNGTPVHRCILAATPKKSNFTHVSD